jgi:hypothetical protein
MDFTGDCNKQDRVFKDISQSLSSLPSWFTRLYCKVDLDSTSPCVLVAMDTHDYKRWGNIVTADDENWPKFPESVVLPQKRLVANNSLILKHTLKDVPVQGFNAREGFVWSGSSSGARGKGDFLVLMSRESFLFWFGPESWYEIA